MTSLFPGLLFSSSGLNKKLIPGSPETVENERKLKRMSLNGHPWPKNSPVSTVYDVCNSSTRLIVLNNKFSRISKSSRLRGQTSIEGDIVKPEPERHSAKYPERIKCHYHQQCIKSDLEGCVTVWPSRFTSASPRINRSQDSSLTYNGSWVNPIYHVNCQSNIECDTTSRHETHQFPVARPTFRRNRTLAPNPSGSSLSQGEKLYLNSIKKVYDVDDMRQRKRMQCSQLLWNAISKGNYKFEDLVKYSQYLGKPDKTKTRPLTTGQLKCSRSAPGSRKGLLPYTDEIGPRPQTKVGSKLNSSRGLTHNTSKSNDRKNVNKISSDQQECRETKEKDEGEQLGTSGRQASVKSLLSLVLNMPTSSSMSRPKDEGKLEKRPDKRKEKTHKEEAVNEENSREKSQKGELVGDDTLSNGEDTLKETSKGDVKETSQSDEE